MSEPFDFPRELRCDSVMLAKSHPYTADMLGRAATEIERLTELAKLQGQEIGITRERDEALVKHLHHLATVCCDEDALRLLDSLNDPVSGSGERGNG